MVPDLLRELREEAGLTQRDLGELLNVPHQWVHKCETGSRRVDIAEFCDWCEGCGVDPSKVIADWRTTRKRK